MFEELHFLIIAAFGGVVGSNVVGGLFQDIGFAMRTVLGIAAGCGATYFFAQDFLLVYGLIPDVSAFTEVLSYMLAGTLSGATIVFLIGMLSMVLDTGGE